MKPNQADEIFYAEEKDPVEFYRQFLYKFKPKIEEIEVEGEKIKRLVFEKKLDCRGFVFPEIPDERIPYGNEKVRFSFKYAEFKKPVNFYKTVFKGSMDFSGAVFREEAEFYSAKFYWTNFRDTIFEKYADFAKAQFYGKSNFMWAKFKRGVSFRGTYFKDVDFRAAEFTGPTDFTRTTLDSAFFDSATFNGIAEFNGITSRDTITFGDTTFNFQAYFSEDPDPETDKTNKPAVFEGHAIFERAKFLKEAYFDGAEFNSTVNFHKARFNNLVNFYRAIFRGDVNTFSRITFGGDAQFSEVIFAHGVSFEGSIFEGTAQFIETRFSETDFTSATFTNLVTFYDAVFKGDAIFKGVTFERIAIFTGKPKEEKHKFYADLDFSNCDIYKGIEIDIPDKWFKLPKARAEARRIQKISYERLGLYDKADEMLVKYKRALREEKHRVIAFFEWLILDLPSNYLTNPRRILCTSVAIILIFAILYWIGGYYSEYCFKIGERSFRSYMLSNGNICVGTIQKPTTGQPIKDLLNSLYYSIVTFTTLGYGDINPTGLMKAISSVEALLGALLIATLVSVGVQKITR